MAARRKAATKRPPKPKPNTFTIWLGSPNEWGEPKPMGTEAASKAAIRTYFRSMEAWCERFNKAGLAAINATIEEMDQASPLFVGETQEFFCLIDEHTGMTLRGAVRRNAS